MKKSLLVVISTGLILSGCNQHSLNSSESSTTHIILNAMGNGLLGQSAAGLSKPVRKQALEAEYKALEYTDAGKSVDWASPKGDASGSVTPGQPYQVGSQNCRQYSHSFTINGVPQTARGSACRNSDGSWTPLT